MQAHQLTALLLLTFGCGGEDVDEAGGRALWQEIQSAGYGSWQRAPGYETPQPTVRAHGQTALVYLNAVMSDALGGPPAAAWPVGSLAVKESLEGERIELVAAMKRETDGWYYAEWSASGEVKYAGVPDVCTGCHSAGEDSLLAVALP